MEALPLYYAERSGMLNQAEADIRLDHYDSMMDGDTAIAGGHVHVTMTDVARLDMLMRQDSIALTPIAATASHIGLYSPKGKKIKSILQLKERLIALERFSYSDYQSDQILRNTDLTTLDIFRVQVGSTALRYEMLRNGLVDAAFLPSPYSLLCDTTMAVCLWEQSDSIAQWTVMAVPTAQTKDCTRCQQVNALLKVYEKAQQALQQHPDTALLHRIYREDYGIPERQLRRTTWYKWKPGRLLTDSTTAKARKEAERWYQEERQKKYVAEES